MRNILLFNQGDTTELFQNQETQQFNIIPDPQQTTPILQNVPDPSETATIQNVSELSDEIINNPQSLTITTFSNILHIPVHIITPHLIQNQTQNDTTQNPNHDNTFNLSTSETQITQEFQTQQTSPPNYDPPPLPSQYSTRTTPHTSPQQGSSNTHTTKKYNSKQQPQQRNKMYQP